MKNPIKLEVPDVQQHLLLSLLGEKKKKKKFTSTAEMKTFQV